MKKVGIRLFLRNVIVTFTLLVSITAVCTYMLRLHAHSALEQSFEYDLILVNTLPRIRSLIRETELDLLTFISTQDQSYLKSRSKDLEELGRLQKTLTRLADSAREKALIEEIERSLSSFIELQNQLINQEISNDLATDEALRLINEQSLLDKSLDAIPGVRAENLLELQERRATASNYSSYAFLILVGVSALIALFVSNYLTRKLAAPLRQIVNACDQWKLGEPWKTGWRYQLEELDLLSEHLRKSSERQNKQYQKLRIANQELDRFAGIVSHDLKNPLVTIKQSMELLDDSGNLEEEDLVEIRQIAIRTVERMEALINNLLTMARIGEDALKIEQVDTTKVVELVLTNLEEQIKKSNAKVKVDRLPVLQADKSQLAQLFENLVSNALKYTSEAAPTITISSQEEDEQYTFCVADLGEGIPEESIPHLFDAFYRSPGHATRSGHGLGLAICKRIVALHGGQIWVNSKVGEGSQFYFSLKKRG